MNINIYPLVKNRLYELVRALYNGLMIVFNN